MPTFQTIPIIVEARQITRENCPEIAKWCGAKVLLDTRTRAYEGLRMPVFDEHERTFADIGDWIVQNINGPFYAYSPAEFNLKFKAI